MNKHDQINLRMWCPFSERLFNAWETPKRSLAKLREKAKYLLLWCVSLIFFLLNGHHILFVEVCSLSNQTWLVSFRFHVALVTTSSCDLRIYVFLFYWFCTSNYSFQIDLIIRLSYKNWLLLWHLYVYISRSIFQLDKFILCSHC